MIDEWQLQKYMVLTLNQDPPLIPYWKYRIDGVIYNVVPVYDLPRCIIAIEAEGSFIGKTVEFV